MQFRRSRTSVSLRGEITEAPPIYRFFRSPYDVKVWAIAFYSFVAVFWPVLLAGGTDVALYIMGLGVLVWMGKQAYEHLTVKRKLDEFLAQL